VKTRILSDLHLGHSSSRVQDVEMLRPLLEGCDHLLLAGDVWQERCRGVGLERARRMFGEFKELIQEVGVSVEMLRGNHDIGTPQGVAWLEQKQILITHGDAVYDSATPWSREMAAHRDEVAKVIARYASLSDSAQACSDRANEIAKTIKPQPLPPFPAPFNFFATAVCPPSRLFEMLRVWAGMGEEGLRFLQKSGEGAQILICGHFHRVGVWEREGRVYINIGAFMRGCVPWAVDVEEGWLTVRGVKKGEESFHFDDVKARFLLRRDE